VRRREFITLIGSAAAAWPLIASAQPPAMPVIGFLRSTTEAGSAHLVTAFRQGLNEAGFVEGRNMAIEYRWANDHYDRLPALAAELVRRQVAVIVANAVSTQAAKTATATIPIVVVSGIDPVRAGLVASLSRPGGNITGVMFTVTDVTAKRLELLRELDTAFVTLVRLRVGALAIGADPFFTSRSEQLAALTVRHAVPAVYEFREFVAAGGLIGYGASLADAYRQAGTYVARILKGDKPADLPVQQSTKVELIINLKTAKALGLTVPVPLLGRADEVIE
jgi:putative ABC transport system substrate-binding protein